MIGGLYETRDLGKLIVETTILLSARTQPDGGKVLRAAAHAYKVDTDAIALKVQAGVCCEGEGEDREEGQAKTGNKNLKKTA